MGNRITANAKILARRVREVSVHARDNLNVGLALKDWRQAYRNRGNRNAIFMWVPKTAGNSIFSVLDQYGTQNLRDQSRIERYFENRGIVTFSHISVRHLREAGYISEDYWESAWKFAFVRNPYGRAVSLFKYLQRVGRLPATTTFRIFCTYLEERAFEPVGLHNCDGLSMMNPQVAWLVDDDGTLLPNYISKVRDADAGYEKIVRKLGLVDAPATMPRENASPDPSIASYYDEETRAIVADAYRQDFETFGFDPAFMPD